MKKSFFGKKILVKIFTLFVILNFNIFAETYTWNGSVSDNWNDAGNWDETSATPDGYNIILAPGSTYNVDFSTRSTDIFASLVVEAGVSIEINSDITVTNAFTNNGTVTVLDSGITITCGSIENNGYLQNKGTVTVSDSGIIITCGSIENNGTIKVSNNATFSGMFTNKGNLSVHERVSQAESA